MLLDQFGRELSTQKPRQFGFVAVPKQPQPESGASSPVDLVSGISLPLPEEE